MRCKNILYIQQRIRSSSRGREALGRRDPGDWIAAPCKKRRARNDDGFTLLEILIALFIFTIISLILTSALHNAISTQSEVEKKSAELTRIQMALLLMSRDIEQTINRPVTNLTNGLDGFIGTPQSLTFTHAGLNNPFGLLQRSTLQRVSYQWKNESIWRMTSPVLDQAAATAIDQRKILSGVTAFKLEYIDGLGHFQPNWPPLATAPQQKIPPLPNAVRVSMTLKKWGTISQLYIIVGQPIEQTITPAS